jgi:hypothetical protein
MDGNRYIPADPDVYNVEQINVQYSIFRKYLKYNKPNNTYPKNNKLSCFVEKFYT